MIVLLFSSLSLVVVVVSILLLVVVVVVVVSILLSYRYKYLPHTFRLGGRFLRCTGEARRQSILHGAHSFAPWVCLFRPPNLSLNRGPQACSYLQYSRHANFRQRGFTQLASRPTCSSFADAERFRFVDVGL